MLYDISKKLFEDKEYLFHFTGFETFKKIIDSKQIWLSNFEKLNDDEEKMYLNNFWKNKVFIACFTDHLSDYFFENYNNKEGKDKALAIKINNTNGWYQNIVSIEGYKFEYINDTIVNYSSYMNPCDWALYDVTGLSVIFKDNPANDFKINKEIIEFFNSCVNINKQVLIEDNTDIECQGFVKKRGWDEESEYRVRACIRPKGMEQKLYYNEKKTFYPPFNKIAIDISNIIESLEVYITVEFSQFENLRELCEKFNIKINIIEK